LGGALQKEGNENTHPPKPLSGQFGLLIPEPEVEEKVSLSPIEYEAEKKENERRENAKNLGIDLLYDPPFWSAPPKFKYHLDVMKEGVVVEKIEFFKQGYYLVGRAPICDVVLDHNSISRQHAVVQFRRTGEAYIFDLGSSHGTFVNKKRILTKTYFKLESGNNIIKFGESTRFYVLDAGLEQPEINKNVKEMKEEEESPEKEEVKKPSLYEDDFVLDQDDKYISIYSDYYEDEEDDEYYDRTKKKKKQTDKVETFETLNAKKKLLEKEMESLILEVESLKSEMEEKKKSKIKKRKKKKK